MTNEHHKDSECPGKKRNAYDQLSIWWLVGIEVCCVGMLIYESSRHPLEPTDMLTITGILLFGLVFWGAINFCSITWSQLIAMRCCACNECLPFDIPWKCGHCDSENSGRGLATFLNRCSQCKRRPKSFVCVHCDTNVALDGDNYYLNPAFLKGPRVTRVVPVAKPTREEQKESRQIEKEKLLHEIEIARLALQLEELKKSAVFKKEVSEETSYRFSEFEKHTMGVHMFAKQKRQEYAERFKDEPEFLEQANEALAEFVEQELIRSDRGK